MSSQKVSRTTRKNIFDVVSVEQLPWHGRLDEIAFLQRVYDLQKMTSMDHRLANAEQDIKQHRLNFRDWPDDWIFSDPRFQLLAGTDELFLNFLCEMVHPVVSPDEATTRQLVELLNEHLAPDGFELVERFRLKGRPVWTAVQRGPAGSAAIAAVAVARAVFDFDYIRAQLTRMQTAVETDPALAIGTAKELVESTCKAILDARGVMAPKRSDLPKLAHLAMAELQLVPDQVTNSGRASDSARMMGSSLSGLVASISELRNQHGTGHGQAPARSGLSARHARLVVGAASTLAVFLWETHLEQSSVKPGVSHG